ncbi:MAG: TetR/AcrR family transcriptional regulator C-terminal domain-containing protein [Oscillospiraceae bacterium]|nr:TetR/AcrR family transcriptional regulator C-terminal domain-containing protein [Oscillospiraceae bacterium]
METETKLKIAKSFEKLLKEKNFDSITVKEIIESSGVSKSTFYRHFKDKYAIIEYECLKSGMIFEFYKSGDIISLHSMHRNLMEYIYSKRELYSEIVKIDGQNSFVEAWNQSGMEIFVRIFKEKHNSVPDEIIKIAELYCNGMAMFVRNWVVRGFKESPEYISNIAYAGIPEAIKKYL